MDSALKPDAATQDDSQKGEKPQASTLLNYEYWKGRQRFFCKGRVQSGPNVVYPIFTFLLINALCGVAIGLNLQQLSQYYGNYVILAFGIVLQVLSSTFLVLTALSDPGTIPSREFLRESTQNWNDLSTFKHSNWIVMQQQNFVKLKFCYTCELYRPARAIHCDDCNACILKLDHHCPWVGNCVGKLNYRYFLLFVDTTALLILYQMACGIWNLVLSKVEVTGDINATLREIPYSMIILILGFCFLIFILVLGCYHNYLVILNQTTNENLKHTFRSTGNPFRTSFFNNIRLICTPSGKRMLWNPRALPKIYVRSKTYEVEKEPLFKPKDEPLKIEEVNIKVQPGEIHVDDGEKQESNGSMIASDGISEEQANESKSVYYPALHKMEIYNSVDSSRHLNEKGAKQLAGKQLDDDQVASISDYSQ